MKTIFSISLITLIALLSFNFQNYRFLSKVKTTVTLSESEAFNIEDSKVMITFSDVTKIVTDSILTLQTEARVEQLTLESVVTVNPTLNQLYLAHAPPASQNA